MIEEEEEEVVVVICSAALIEIKVLFKRLELI